MTHETDRDVLSHTETQGGSFDDVVDHMARNNFSIPSNINEELYGELEDAGAYDAAKIVRASLIANGELQV